MTRPRHLIYFLVSGAVAAFAGGFLAALFFVLFAAGPLLAFLPGSFIGLRGGLFGLELATLPAVVLGGMLWHFRISNKWAWAGTGALAGLGLYVMLLLFPALIEESARGMIFGPAWLAVAPAFALAAAPAALLFRRVMQDLTAFDDPPPLD